MLVPRHAPAKQRVGRVGIIRYDSSPRYHFTSATALAASPRFLGLQLIEPRLKFLCVGEVFGAGR